MTSGILAVRLRTLGDVVLTTPALRALKRGYPGDPLEVVTEERYVPLLEGLPEVDRVWPLERTAAGTLGLVRALRRRRWRWAVDFFGNTRSAVIARACGAARCAGYELRGRRHAYHLRVARNASAVAGRPEYAAATHRRLATAVGGIDDGLDARVAVSETSRAAAARLLADRGLGGASRTVGLVGAGTWPAKSWPASHAALLARALLAAGWAVLLVTGPGEEAATSRIAGLVPRARVLPPCDLGTLAAVIERLSGVVGTDSGPRHLAAALGVPSFAWFGSSDPDIWNPPGAQHGFWWSELSCRGCGRTSCPHWNCLPSLDAPLAARLVLDHLARHAV